MIHNNFSLAFIHDWLTIKGGSEKVLQVLLHMYPKAPVYTLVYAANVFANHPVTDHEITTSFINKLPRAQTKYRSYLPLMPLAIEQFDLQDYQVLLSSSHAVAHGILPAADQLHINYIYTPVRYAWRLYHDYIIEANLNSGIRGAMAKVILHYLRLWDLAASQRVDKFISISHWVSKNVWRAYRRKSKVIYPPVDVDLFRPQHPRADYYITVSRLVPNKKIAMIIDVFSKLDYPLMVIGDGPELENLSSLATPNIDILGWQSDEVVREMLGRAKAFIQVAEEDFGIASVEAQASGCPVIAFGRGGVLETVIPGKTGVFFDEQIPASLQKVVQDFESGAYKFKTTDLLANVERFRRERFELEFGDFVDRAWEEFVIDPQFTTEHGSNAEARP
ncbi:MAG: glycosyltransferase [Chloroflexi bacterium]|nr:glycosyltransferase [Chloroflexota bacterium]